MRIEVESSNVEERGGFIKSGERKGEKWSMRAQVGWLYNGGKYPVKVSLPLSDDQQPYQPGFYTFAPECFEAGDFDRMQFARRIVLVATEAAVKPQLTAAK